MHDPRIAIWNTLHDGEITVMAHEEPCALVIFVSIPYLRERIPPLGDSFRLRLRGFRSIEFSDFEGTAKTADIAEIARTGIEILSTDTEIMPVRVAVTTGFLTLDFDSLEISLDTGEIVQYEEVLRACEEYWDEWSARHAKA